ncbi:hypothetical protein [Variovorax sp. PBL-E5]|uniref:hypothetical protein n=1 Tax=Variovorax sp. PBL-E5 TaxID=434014 RepID=UPI0013178A4C|nr:hypothetical protein [Variovorax sp. PBL-E5]VTU16431.1 hypothetical protein E5CHR_00131 [Variovorax sp. PBL-E5]
MMTSLHNSAAAPAGPGVARPPRAGAGWPSGATTQALLGMLCPAFGSAVAHAVLQALGHDLGNPRALTRQEIETVVSAAEISRTAMSGLSFLSRILLLAEGDSAAFHACVAAAGVDPETLSVDTRARIDGAFALEMAAAGSDRRGVDLRAAQPLMQRAIGSVLSRTW